MNRPTTRQDAGAIIRSARRAQGLTLAELGRRTGYSPSQVSRYERGLSSLTDTVLLRRFAAALGLSPQVFGVLPEIGAGTQKLTVRNAVPTHAPAFSVVREHWEGGEDRVRRRRLLTDAASLAAAGAFGLPHPATKARPADIASGLENQLYGSGPGVEPISLADLRHATTRARKLFQSARYGELAARLPRLIATATATRDHVAGPDRLVASNLLAEAYLVTSGFMVKLNDDQLAWATADRAVQAAQAAEDPLTLADANRSIAVVLRRTGRRDRAHTLLIDAADAIDPGPAAGPEQLSMYGTLLVVAAYTAAVDGDRAGARDLIDVAGAAAARLGRDANHRHTSFGPTNVALYQISMAQVLDDCGAAVARARRLHPSMLPTAERRGRYWIDVARAWHQWGKPEACFRSLLAAERAAPAEVRYRPPVHRITLDLLRAERRGRLPGLRDFAKRVGVSA